MNARPQTIDAREIESFVPAAGGTSGGRASFSVRLRHRGRTPKVLVSGLRSKADAQKIARLLWRGVQGEG